MLFIYGPLEYDRESLASKEHFQPLTQLFPNISLSKKKKKVKSQVMERCRLFTMRWWQGRCHLEVGASCKVIRIK